MNQNGKFGLLMSSVVSFGICVWFAMLLRRFETEWISVIRIEVLSCTRSLAQLIVGKKQLRNTHTHVDEKQFIYIKRLVELVTLHIALQASLGVWLARGNGHASHAPCIATFGKTLACKHWKIQNSYFAISLSFFCIFLFRLVVLNLCCHLCWHFFDIFFCIFSIFFCHLVCHLLVIFLVILHVKLHVMFSYRFCLLVKGQLVLLCCHLLQRIWNVVSQQPACIHVTFPHIH